MSIKTNSICKILVTAFFLLTLLNVNAQPAATKYNKQLADSLGADDYGMKMYILVILKTGTNKIEDKKITDSLFMGHMRNINHLAETGKLVVAGPMGKNTNEYRGIFILNVKTTEEANVLLDMDPAIKSKLLDAELYPWYGSAALPMYFKHHGEVKKKDF